FPHFPSLPWVRYVARLPVARVRLPSGSPSQDLFSERPLPAYRPQGPVRVASAARTVRLRYVEFGAGGDAEPSHLFWVSPSAAGTWPFGRTVRVWNSRGMVMLPVSVEAAVAGSNSVAAVVMVSLAG